MMEASRVRLTQTGTQRVGADLYQFAASRDGILLAASNLYALNIRYFLILSCFLVPCVHACSNYAYNLMQQYFQQLRTTLTRTYTWNVLQNLLSKTLLNPYSCQGTCKICWISGSAIACLTCSSSTWPEAGKYQVQVHFFFSLSLYGSDHVSMYMRYVNVIPSSYYETSPKY